MRAALVLLLVALQPVLFGPFAVAYRTAANEATPFEVHATTPAAIKAIRSRLVAQIWAERGYPLRTADAITSNVNPLILESSIPFVNLRQVDRYVVTTNGNTVQPLVLRPIASNGKLVIVGLGHAISGTLAGVTTTPQLINIALERGATVLLTPMPLGGTAAHDALGTQRTSAFHPMQYFLDPGIVALNTYLAQNPAPTEILAAGISGGGWSTVMISALDTRVTSSFPIAGSLPLNLRDTSNVHDYGDWEQRLHDLTVDRQGTAGLSGSLPHGHERRADPGADQQRTGHMLLLRNPANGLRGAADVVDEQLDLPSGIGSRPARCDTGNNGRDMWARPSGCC